MIISKNISGYIFSKDKSIKAALSRLDSTALQILFLVDKNGLLNGVVTDGDIRRWLLQQSEVDLTQPISLVAPKDYLSAEKGTKLSQMKSILSKDKKQIPLVDGKGHLVGVLTKESQNIIIGDKTIGQNHPTYIIAEIGNNHQGSLDNAKKLIDMASNAGVDSVKFQMRSMDKLYGANNKIDSWDLGAQYTSDLLSKYQLSDKDLFKAFDYCKKMKVEPICTPWDLDSLKKLEDYGLAAYKVASADFTNHELLRAVAETNTPMICSTGMCSEEEILSGTELLKDHGAQCILLHCNSTYPTPYKDINLNYLKKLKNYGFEVGYSGHERGGFIPLAAVSLGACIVEKHITLDKNQEGNDHKVSLLREELVQMVEQIRNLDNSMGNDNSRAISQGELMNREVLAKSLYAKTDINLGEKITREMIGIKSPGQGLQPNNIESLIGRTTNRSIEKDTFFYHSDLQNIVVRKSNYSFDRPYGIPVRYHDFESLTSSVNLDFVEFHLSYQDLTLNPSDFIPKQNSLSFSVHAPELFEGDHILDLCSVDENYRQLSITHLNQVIEHVLKISKSFPKETYPPILVVNAGGWDQDGFIDTEKKDLLYKNLAESLTKVSTDKVQIAIQTMPPFPWHFGGQSHHNLFVNPEEIKKFCDLTGYKICLDISHSMMACNYFGWSLEAFIEQIGDHVIYLHVVDALGSDGEGVQIGKGDVNFINLAKSLTTFCPKAPFIPEIWQGHKDNGAGFWDALGFLEDHL